MKHLVWALPLALLSFGASAKPFPTEARLQFMNGCLETSKGNRKYCECALRLSESRYSHEEFGFISYIHDKYKNDPYAKEFEAFRREVAQKCN